MLSIIVKLTFGENHLRPNFSANTHSFSKVLFLFVRTYWEVYFYLKNENPKIFSLKVQGNFKQLRPCLNVQSDSICAKVFV